MDQDDGIARDTFVRRWLRCDRNGTLPSIKSMFDASRRYLRNDYHQEGEATLALSLALEYFAKSPAVQAALHEQRLKKPVAA